MNLQTSQRQRSSEQFCKTFVKWTVIKALTVIKGMQKAARKNTTKIDCSLLGKIRPKLIAVCLLYPACFCLLVEVF